MQVSSSSLNTANFPPAAQTSASTVAVAVDGVESNKNPQNQPSTVVTLSSAGAAQAYSPVAVHFKDLGAMLLNRFKTNTGSLSQSVKQFTVDGTLDPSNLHKGLATSVTLSIKTASGAEVKLSLASQGAGLAVSIEGGDNLSDKERDAIAGLAGGLQDALNGLASSPPSPNLTGLTQFDSKTLASVDLQESVGEGASAASITFHADKQGRSVKVSGAAGKLEVGVDTSNPLIQGERAQRIVSMNNYLHQIDTAAKRGHGDQTLIDMFKNAFVQMNSDYGPQDKSVYKAPLAARDQAPLTGLADFHVSVTGNTRSPNPRKHDEVDAFSWTASQSTTVGGKSERDRMISQQQQAHLVASYHKALNGGAPPELTSDSKTQNYYYDQIDDTAQSKLDLGYEDDKLVNATLSQSASQSLHETKFVEAKLVQDTTTPAYQAQSLNLLELLKSVELDGQDKPGQKDKNVNGVLAKVHALIQLQTTPLDLLQSPLV